MCQGLHFPGRKWIFSFDYHPFPLSYQYMNSCCSVFLLSSLFPSVAKLLGRVTHTSFVSLSLSYHLADDTLASTQSTCSGHHFLLPMASSYPHYCHSAQSLMWEWSGINCWTSSLFLLHLPSG